MTVMNIVICQQIKESKECYILQLTGLGVDFMKQFKTYAQNLCFAPIFFAPINSNWASYICALLSNYFIFSQIWVRSTLNAMRPTFMKSTLSL
jgi:hypothetical protein